MSGISLFTQERLPLNDAGTHSWLGVPFIDDFVRQARLRWLGHVARTPDIGYPRGSFLRSGKMRSQPHSRVTRRGAPSKVALVAFWQNWSQPCFGRPTAAISLT